MGWNKEGDRMENRARKEKVRLAWLDSEVVEYNESYLEELLKKERFEGFYENLISKIDNYIETKTIPPRYKNTIFSEFTRKYTMYGSDFWNLFLENTDPVDEKTVIKQFLHRKLYYDIPAEEGMRSLDDLEGISRTTDLREKYSSLYESWIETLSRIVFISSLADVVGLGGDVDPLEKRIEEFESIVGKENIAKLGDGFMVSLINSTEFISYEKELMVDSLRFAYENMKTPDRIGQIGMLEHLKEELETNEEAVEDFFLYSNKHFNGDIDISLNQLVGLSKVNPESMLKSIYLKEKQNSLRYEESMSKLLEFADHNGLDREDLLERLKEIQDIVWVDRYENTKLSYVVDPISSVRAFGKVLTENIKENMKTDYGIGESELEDFTSMDSKFKEILGLDETAHQEIIKKMINSGILKEKSRWVE